MADKRCPDSDPQRRQFVTGLLVLGVAQIAPWALATSPAPTPTPAPAAASPAFLALSHYLTEREGLNPRLAARMQAALQALDASFATKAEALWRWIDGQRIPLAAFDGRLKAEQPELAATAEQTMQVWVLGIAGADFQTRVLAFEYALNAQLVADKLKPPTYAYGLPGSWSLNPNSFDLKLAPVPA